jgi:predicted MFS family arabinose efflux permease
MTMTPVPFDPARRARGHGPARRWWTLVAVCGATFMLMADLTVVQVALPTIQHDLRASFTDLQWLIDAYALTLAAFILTSGSLADRFGRKRVFIAGLGVFTLASLLCAAAGSAPDLIAARAVQGFGGAAMLATGLALIGQEFTGPDRARAIAAWGATVGIAVAGVSAATFAIGAGMFAIFPYLTLYLQDNLGYSPLAGGLCLLPATILTFLVPLATRPAAGKLPPRIALSAGLAITALGLAVMHGLTVSSTWTALIPGLLLAGTGIGLANPAIATIALGIAPPQRAGMASGISNTFRVAGLAAGVAVLGAVVQRQLASSLTAQLGHPAGQLAKALASGATRAPRSFAAAQHLTAASHHAFASGTNQILAIGSILTLSGALAALALVRARDFHQPAAAPRQPEPISQPAPA